MVLVLGNELILWPSTPAVDTADTHLEGTDLYDGVVAGDEVAAVALVGILARTVVQISHLIGEGRDFHGTTGFEVDIWPGGTFHAPPDDVTMIAAFLGAYVPVPILILHGTAIDADEGIVLAVAVVLDRTTANVADGVVVFIQSPSHF